LVVEDTGDEVLVHRTGRSDVYYLNGTAALVWRLCDGQRTLSEIVALLSDAYPDDAETVRAQVPELLDELLENSVVEPVQ
jgi:hypothetical protein